MDTYLPKHLQNNICGEKMTADSNGGYKISFKFTESNNTVFHLYKTKNSVSTSYLNYMQKIDALEKKHEVYKKKGYMFGTMNKGNGRIFFGCSKDSTFISLEDITDLVKQMKEDVVRMIVKAISSSSGFEYEIFNSNKHGYDAIISQHKNLTGKDKLTKSICKKCGNDTFEVFIKIHNVGRKDLLDEQPCIEITEENWMDAFDWIVIDRKCAKCGKVTKKWFEWETM